MEKKQSRFHSVILDEPSCCGCTVCITTCPVEAIRVRSGKSHILEERCIDCGECIRRCPHHAKKALAAGLEQLENYDYKIALPAPSLYAQFSETYSTARIRKALKSLGFDDICDVAEAALEVSEATAVFLRDRKADTPRPIISSSCPAIIKLIQVHFPTLMEHLLPVLPPVEVAARHAREKADLLPENKNRRTGVFFISPCAAKITAARSPLGYEKSETDGVLSINDLYLPLLGALKSIAEPDENETVNPQGYGWSCSSGEVQALLGAAEKPGQKIRWKAADGIEQAAKLLEAIEDGKLSHIDFAEITACTGGCTGGPLTVNIPPVAKEITRRRSELSRCRTDSAACREKKPRSPEDIAGMLWTQELSPRPALLLDPDYKKARAMMEEMEEIVKELPGLDCGSCGAPNCRALAEDIVRRTACREDCIFILRDQYEKLIGEKR